LDLFATRKLGVAERYGGKGQLYRVDAAPAEPPAVTAADRKGEHILTDGLSGFFLRDGVFSEEGARVKRPIRSPRVPRAPPLACWRS